MSARALAALAAVLLALVGWAPAAVADSRDDTLSVHGFDDPTIAWSQVVELTTTNNLIFTYTARSALRNGTLSLRLPRRDWPTRLRHLAKFRGIDSRDHGGVTPRPLRPWFPPKRHECDRAPGTRLRWRVVRTARAQIVVLRHLQCDAGDHIQVRMRVLEAPTVGRYPVRGHVTSADGSRERLRTVVRVRRTPRVQLQLTPPADVVVHRSFPVTVRAVRLDGDVATQFTGVIRVYSPRNDCSFEGPESRRWVMRASDQGVIHFRLWLQSELTTRIWVRDVARRARPGLSAPFTVTWPPDEDQSIACPVAFH